MRHSFILGAKKDGGRGPTERRGGGLRKEASVLDDKAAASGTKAALVGMPICFPKNKTLVDPPSP
jgi:hypothetical protein